MSKQPIRISITTGDSDGIGTEVTSKSLQKLKPQKGTYFYLWRDPRCPKKYLNKIDSQFERICVQSWPEALAAHRTSYRQIIDINSPLPPAAWVEASAKACLHGHIDAIATAPISKTGMLDSGYKEVGHTELLKKVSKSKDVYMTFLGKEFNVLLATGHLAIKNVSKNLTLDNLVTAIHAANKVRGVLKASQSKKPLALVGLNPHSGEEGIIGSEERDIFSEAMKKAIRSGVSIEGPLVPDVAFNPVNWKKYSIYVCPYHDQGLIPFKMIHGQDSGVHITMGLPFIRTSVDHGTAKNIFGKNRANPESMKNAIQMAIKLSVRNRK